jgi:hypothetical protein
MELLSCGYWWLQFWKFMKAFVGCCDVCARAKNPCHHLHGLLQPFFIWSSISMDFIMDLPQSNSFDSILMVVDRLMKMAYFIHYNISITGKMTTRLFLDHVFCYQRFFFLL